MINWFHEVNDRSNFGKRKLTPDTRVACQLHVSIQSQSLVRAARSLRAHVYGRIGLNARISLLSRERTRANRTRRRDTQCRDRVDAPSFAVALFLLFTGAFYFRLRGIFRSAIAGRPEMSRVAVTRRLFRFIPGNVECERERKRYEMNGREREEGLLFIT